MISKNPEQNFGINLTTLEEISNVSSPGFPFFAEETSRTFFTNDSYPWHWHQTVQFFYVTRGQMNYSVPGKTYTFMEGDGGFLNANTLHSLEYPDKEPCTFVYFLLHPALIGGELQSDIMTKYVRPITDNSNFEIYRFRRDNAEHQVIIDMIREICNIYENKPVHFELLIRSQLSLLWASFDDLTYNHRISLTPKVSSSRIKSMIAYLVDHYAEKITLDDIAEAGMCSKRECNRTFTQQMHTTPIDYLLTIRLQKAATLLVETELSVTEIGASCGFNSTSYFIKQFREKYIYSPKEYRKYYNSYHPLVKK